jgi:hypothetical protein
MQLSMHSHQLVVRHQSGFTRIPLRKFTSVGIAFETTPGAIPKRLLLSREAGVARGEHYEVGLSDENLNTPPLGIGDIKLCVHLCPTLQSQHRFVLIVVGNKPVHWTPHPLPNREVATLKQLHYGYQS